MQADIYAYGHLVPSALSLTIAAAFALLAIRVADLRADLAYAVTALLCSATGLAAMIVALDPGLGHARLLFAVAVPLYVSVPILWHLQFAADVLTPERRRRHARLLVAYAGVGALVESLVVTGVLDGGRLRALEVGPFRSAVVALPWWAVGALFLFALAIVPLSLPLLAGAGPRRRERRSALPIMVIAPPLCAHELLCSAGLIDMVPLGGYVAGLASVQGLVILSERFRAMSERHRLGPYRIGRRLGGGGMAEVFEARRTGAGALAGVAQSVALKRLRSELAADPREARRLVDEARILSRLSHPNIVALYDAGYEGGELFIALELVDGVTLAHLIAAAEADGRALGARAAAAIGAQAARALACAHAFRGEGAPAGLIHRDVSPHNLLVDRRGCIKLADFGIARPRADSYSTTARGMVGKLPYMAPEQLRGGVYDQRVDIHALGVVLFQVACGALPYDGSTDGEIAARILEGTPGAVERLRAADRALAAVVESMIASDPAARPADAGELAERLAALCDEPAAASQLAADVERAMSSAAAGEPPTARPTRALGRRRSPPG